MGEAREGLCSARYWQEKNSLVSSAFWEDLMAKPAGPASDQMKSPCIYRNLICGHLENLVFRPLYLQEKKVLVCIMNKNYA